MTPAEKCKQLTGLQLARVAELTGISHRQLSKWHYSKPNQFKIMCEWAEMESKK